MGTTATNSERYGSLGEITMTGRTLLISGSERSFKVGDLAQAEVNDGLQFTHSKRLEETVEHGGQSWVHLKGETAAVWMDQVILHEAAREGPAAPPKRDLSKKESTVPEGWSEENLLDDAGSEIKIRYHGKASVERYDFIRDYLDFKIKRLQKTAPKAPDPEPTA